MFSVRRPREVRFAVAQLPIHRRDAPANNVVMRADSGPCDEQLVRHSHAVVGYEAIELHQHATITTAIPAKPRALTEWIEDVSGARPPKSASLPALFFWHQSRRRFPVCPSQLHQQRLRCQQRQEELCTRRFHVPDTCSALIYAQLRAERPATQQRLQVAHIAWSGPVRCQAVLLSDCADASGPPSGSTTTKGCQHTCAHGPRAPRIPHT